jgi:hypothetical protein
MTSGFVVSIDAILGRLRPAQVRKDQRDRLWLLVLHERQQVLRLGLAGERKRRRMKRLLHAPHDPVGVFARHRLPQQSPSVLNPSLLHVMFRHAHLVELFHDPPLFFRGHRP